MKYFTILFLFAVIAVQAHAFLIEGAVGTIISHVQAELLKKALTALTVLNEQEKGELSLIQRAITAAARTRCRWTENLSQEEEDEIRANNFDNLSKKQQCFIKCVTDTFRLADVIVDLLPDNQHSLANTFSNILDPLVNEDDAAVVSAECNELLGVSECETSAVRYKCYVQYNATNLI